jgi:hypothetical protein
MESRDWCDGADFVTSLEAIREGESAALMVRLETAGFSSLRIRRAASAGDILAA